MDCAKAAPPQAIITFPVSRFGTRKGAIVSTFFANPNTWAKPCYFDKGGQPTQWTDSDLWTQSVAGTE
jgi:hypothetical protein